MYCSLEKRVNNQLLLKKLILFLALLPLFALSAHKYYLSNTQLEYVEDQQSLQIIINVFLDDIELAVNTDYGIDLQLTTEKELKDNNQYFEKYLKDKLGFKVNDKSVDFKYLGKEYEGDLVLFYLEIEKVIKPKTLEVHNTILTSNFEDQKNVVQLKNGKNRTSEILTKENDKALLNF